MTKHITQEVMELAQKYINFPINENMVKNLLLELEDLFPEYEWRFDLQQPSGNLARICFTDEFTNEITQIVFAEGSSSNQHNLQNIVKELLDEHLVKPTLH